MNPLQTVPEMYYTPGMTTSLAGSYSIPSYGAGYFVPSLPTTTTIAYTNDRFIIPMSYSVPFPLPSIPVSAVTQSQTEEISQMLENITFYSPPTSPQVT